MENNTQKLNKMHTMPVGKLLFNMALPLAISMLVQAFYNVVDSIYVSQISESAVTALSLAFPIQNLMIGCATGSAVGMNALFSKSLGEHDHEKANKTAGNGILASLFMAAMFVVFGMVGAEGYYAMQSEVPETISGGAAYIGICCIWCLGIFVEILGERLLQASGRTIYTLFTQGTGAILNILLDPVFIFGYEPLGIAPMGIAGAAVATVTGQWVAAVLAVFFNLTKNPDAQFSLKYLKFDWPIMKKIMTVGIPSIIMMAIGSVMNFGMNQIFLSFQEYGETAAGVFGIYFKLQSFVFMPLFGINNAAISIIAYNYGACQPKRITGTLKCSLTAAMTIMLLGTAAFQLIPDQLLGIFHPSSTFLELGRSALRIVSLHFPMAAIGIALGASFQAMGTGIYSTITSLMRQIVVLLPAAFLLSFTGDVHNVWWAFPISEVISLLTSLFFYSRIYRNLIKPLYQANA